MIVDQIRCESLGWRILWKGMAEPSSSTRQPGSRRFVKPTDTSQ